MSDVNGEARNSRRRRSFWLVMGAFVAVVGVLVGSGIAASRAEAGWGRRGWGHHGDRDFDPEQAKEHVSHAVGFALSRIDASDEQEAQILAIVNDSIDEMVEGSAEHRARRDALKELFSQPDIDRDALEGLRKAELQLADGLSQRIASVIADIAEVLTPEQRVELLEMSHHRSRHWH